MNNSIVTNNTILPEQQHYTESLLTVNQSINSIVLSIQETSINPSNSIDIQKSPLPFISQDTIETKTSTLPSSNPWLPNTSSSLPKDEENTNILPTNEHESILYTDKYSQLTHLPSTQINLTKLLQHIQEEEVAKKQRDKLLTTLSTSTHSSSSSLQSVFKKPSVMIQDEKRSQRRYQTHQLVQQHKYEQNFEKLLKEETEKVKEELSKVQEVTAQVQIVLDHQAKQEHEKYQRIQQDERAKLHYVKVIESKIFQAWKDYYLLMKRKIVKADNYYRLTRYETIFNHWKSYYLYYRIQHQEEENIQLSIAQQHYNTKLLQKIFRNYRNFYQIIRNKEYKFRKYMDERKKANIWIAWTIITTKEKSHRIVQTIENTKKADQFYRFTLLQKIFRGWKNSIPLLQEEKETEKRQELLMERAKKILYEL